MGLFNNKKKEIGTTITCFACKHEWVFNDTSIPEGATYEVMCPNCKMILKRKKINEKK